jgi:hypothetical protein
VDAKAIKRNIRVSALVVILSAGAFSRLPGIEDVRLVDVVTLLVCGIGIGVFIMNLRLHFKLKKSQ